MMRKKSWITYNRNQNAIARANAKAKGTKFERVGNTLRRVSSADAITYCAACGGPVVDSKSARARHARKGPACAAAMAQQ